VSLGHRRQLLRAIAELTSREKKAPKPAVASAASAAPHVLRQTDRAGLGNTFQSRGNVDAVIHKVAVAFLDHVAEMAANAVLNAALGRQAGVAFDPCRSAPRTGRYRTTLLNSMRTHLST
jgi:hypothetical protein